MYHKLVRVAAAVGSFDHKLVRVVAAVGLLDRSRCHLGMQKAVERESLVAAETEKEKDRRVQQESVVDCYYHLKTCRRVQERCAEKRRG